MGGIPGYTGTETTDENPDRVATVQRMSWAYLSRALGGADALTAASASLDPSKARVEDH